MRKDIAVLPMVTSTVLGAIWLMMTVKGTPVPPILTQAFIASLGSISATQILKGKSDAKN